LCICTNGDFYFTTFEETAHFEDNIRIIEKYDPDKVWSLLLWDADQKFYYGKRFQMTASNKMQNMLGENPQSRIELLSDRDEATFVIHFKDENREPLTLLMEEFIAVKGVTARGKRVTTFDVSKLEDITPEPPAPEPEPEEEENVPDNGSEPAEDAPSAQAEAVPVEESPAEESAPVAEAPAEPEPTPAAEAPVEEQPAEEKPVEEKPKRKPRAKKAVPAEEPAPAKEVAPAEEAGPVAEAPAEVEPAPAAEAPVEEQPAEEKPVEEKPKRKPRAKKAKIEDVLSQSGVAFSIESEVPEDSKPVDSDGQMSLF
ncbi:MAG: hypothetical protein KBS77_06085, partial [Bacteroidales bacterium]|nr:hypothetical protein [Candidatus Colicola faecequi]